MIKKLPFAVFVIGYTLIASVMLNAISFLSKLAPMPAGLNLDQLVRGQLLQLFLIKEFWSHYPSIPSLNLLIVPNTLLLMALLLGGMFYYLAYRQKYRPLVISTVLLLTGLFPYAIEWIALTNNKEPSQAGLWLALMLVGVFYAALACALFSGFQIVKNWLPAVQANG